jgi:integrase
MKLIKKGQYYYASYRTESGSIKTTSTHTTNKLDAIKIAKEAGLDRLEFAAKAGRLTNEVIGQIKSGKRITVAKAIPKFITWLENRSQSASTVHATRLTLERWATAMRAMAIPPAAVTVEHIDKWINSGAQLAKATSLEVHLSSLRTFFDYCSANGWCSGNPARLARVNWSALPHERKEPGMRRSFTEPIYRKLLAYVDTVEADDAAFWSFAIRAAWLLGYRLGDVCRMEWDCIKDQRTIIWTDKYDRRIDLPLPKELADRLAGMQVHQSKRLWPDQHEVNANVTRRAHLSVRFRRLSERAGIDGFTFHSLRHGFARRMRETGVPEETIASMMGHRNTATTSGYGKH